MVAARRRKWTWIRTDLWFCTHEATMGWAGVYGAPEIYEICLCKYRAKIANLFARKPNRSRQYAVHHFKGARVLHRPEHRHKTVHVRFLPNFVIDDHSSTGPCICLQVTIWEENLTVST